MKISSVALLALMALESSHPAFSFQTPHYVASPSKAVGSFGVRSLVVDLATESDIETSDVSIPYDAAAELAYKNWLAKYDKPYDEERYTVFLRNYKAIAVMNVSAKKKVRDDGSGIPSLLSLNEFADCTAEEYEAAMKKGGPHDESSNSVDTDEAPSTTGSILGKAVKNVESQSAASSALQEAADALSEEEQKLAVQLGLESVEELENAIDALEGIGPDGTELDNGNLAREARVRSAYLDWCKEFGKMSDETRFPQFYKNFLEMEDFSKETGKEMVLNEYADFTAEEYNAMSSNGKTEEETKEVTELKEAEKEEAAAKAKEEAAAKAKEEAAAKATVEKEAATQAEEQAKKKAEEEKKKKREEAARLASMTEKERRAEIEKEKSNRQNSQAKKLEKAIAASEAEAIAAARLASEKEARAIAEVRNIQEQAFQIARAKAKDWEEMQAKLNANRRTTPIKPEKGVKPKKSTSAFFAKSNAPSSPTKSFKATPKKVTPAKTAARASSQRPTLNLSSIFESKPTSPASKKSVAKVSPPASKKKETPRPTLSLSSVFEPKAAAPKPVPRTPAPKPTSLASKKTVVKALTPKVPEKPIAKASTSASKKKAAPRPTLSLSSVFEPKRAAPKPVPRTPAPKAAPKPSMPFFSKPTPKQAPAPAPAPTPAKKVPAPAPFSFFGSKPAAPRVAPKPDPAPQPTKSSFSFGVKKPAPVKPLAAAKAAAPAKSKPKDLPKRSLFRSKPKVESKPAPPPKAQAFSLFGASNPATKKPAIAAKTATRVQPKPKSSRSGLSLFGSKPNVQSKPVTTPEPTKAAFSLFGGGSQKPKPASKKLTPAKKAPVKAPKGVPTLSRWKKNRDGSVTGIITGSVNFDDRERVTTSVITKGKISKSEVVTTGSGSRYFLA